MWQLKPPDQLKELMELNGAKEWKLSQEPGELQQLMWLQEEQELQKLQALRFLDLELIDFVALRCYQVAIHRPEHCLPPGPTALEKQLRERS